ncbi:putative oligomerization/nucleic acid binding protein [Paramicrobacterium agarici]|uniref:Putative oligomerization/nucleic acid binding protein n=2 Tax=Paramicrobacterium agarici TaxID=630514 RepID=A0A2A9DX63_9MICO|nr:DUF2510 domain-containing protein [Microbacterium agarici]PFG30499.1 putative oligomerization/nucleic acid binding protein [Microbacterium agarici]
MNAQAPAGWYPDTNGDSRYWDGSAWTDMVQEPNRGVERQTDAIPNPEGVFSKLKKVAGDKQAARRTTKAELERKHSESAQSAGALVTSGVFGTSTIEVYEGGYVRVAVGDRNATAPSEIKRKTPYEKLRSIKYVQPSEEKSANANSALEGAVGSAMTTLIKGGKGLMKASVPGIAVAGVAHLANAEGRRAYLTIATDAAIHTLTNESSNGFISRANKGHNEVGIALETAGLSVLADGDGSKMLEQAIETETPVATRAEATQVTATPTLAERLRELADLHKEGILSDEEFANAKTKLLGGL